MAAKIGAAELGLDPRSGEDSELFKWFLASYLFGKRISGKIAADACLHARGAGALEAKLRLALPAFAAPVPPGPYGQ